MAYLVKPFTKADLVPAIEIAVSRFQEFSALESEVSSLKDRLDCYDLWGRVQNLYKESDDALKTTKLFHYLIALKEQRPYCRACAGDPLAVIGEWDGDHRKRSLFEFTPEEFKKNWPEAEPVRVIVLVPGFIFLA